MNECGHCGEEVKDGEESRMISHPKCVKLHRECVMRMTLGSVGHINQRCECYGGKEGDPPGMTRRQAALAAVEAWSKLHKARRL